MNITYTNAVILYELRSAPPGVKLKSATVSPPGGFSAALSGAQGRVISLYDTDDQSNTGSFNVTLTLTTADGEPFDSDPQIINRPVIR